MLVSSWRDITIVALKSITKTEKQTGVWSSTEPEEVRQARCSSGNYTSQWYLWNAKSAKISVHKIEQKESLIINIIDSIKLIDSLFDSLFDLLQGFEVFLHSAV